MLLNRMQIKSNVTKPQVMEGNRSFCDYISFNKGFISNAQKIFNIKSYRDVQKMYSESRIKEETLHNSESLCISLKLRLDIRSEKNGRSETVFLNINPNEVSYEKQKSIIFEYTKPKRKFNPEFEKLPKEKKMKQLSYMCHELLNKIICHDKYKYELVQLLQSAIFGCVYEAEIIEDGYKEYKGEKKKAIKVLSKELIELAKDRVEEDPFSEYHYRDVMSGHSNVLCCDTIFDDSSFVYMVMPFAIHGDLFEVMKKREHPFLESEARYLFCQILLALKCLHSKNVSLRDISLENVLLFENEENGLVYPVLNDPGQAIYFKVDSKKQVILEPFKKIFGKIFRPPEIYEEDAYDPTKVDIFCTGYILYFVLTKYELFRCSLSKDTFWNMLVNKKYDELLKLKKGTHLSKLAIDLIFNLLEPNFKKRFTVCEALDHPWFKESMTPIYNDTLFNGYVRDVITNSKPSKLKSSILDRAKIQGIKITPSSYLSYRIYEHTYTIDAHGKKSLKNEIIQEVTEKLNETSKENPSKKKEQMTTTTCTNIIQEETLQTNTFMKSNREANQKEKTIMLNNYTTHISNLLERKKNIESPGDKNCNIIDKLIKESGFLKKDQEVARDNKIKKEQTTQELNGKGKNELNISVKEKEKEKENITSRIDTPKLKETEKENQKTNNELDKKYKERVTVEMKNNISHSENRVTDLITQKEISGNNKSKVNILESNKQINEKKESKYNDIEKPKEVVTYVDICNNSKNDTNSMVYNNSTELNKEEIDSSSSPEIIRTTRNNHRNKKYRIFNTKNEKQENMHKHSQGSYKNDKTDIIKKDHSVRNIPTKTKRNGKDIIKLSDFLDELKQEKLTRDTLEEANKSTSRFTGEPKNISERTLKRECCNHKKQNYQASHKLKTKDKDMMKTKESNNRNTLPIKQPSGKNIKKERNDFESLYTHNELNIYTSRVNNEEELLKITDTFTHLHELMSSNKVLHSKNKKFEALQTSKFSQSKIDTPFNKRKTLSFHKTAYPMKQQFTERRIGGTVPFGKRNTIDGRIYIKENAQTEELKKKLLKKSACTKNNQQDRTTYLLMQRQKQGEEKKKQIETEIKKQKNDKYKKIAVVETNVGNDYKEIFKLDKNKMNVKKNEVTQNSSSYSGLTYSFKTKKSSNHEKETLERDHEAKIKEETFSSTRFKRNTINPTSTDNLHKNTEDKEKEKKPIRKCCLGDKKNTHHLSETLTAEQKEKEVKHNKINNQTTNKGPNKKPIQANKKNKEKITKKENSKDKEQENNGEDKNLNQLSMYKNSYRNNENDLEDIKVKTEECETYEIENETWKEEEKQGKETEMKEPYSYEEEKQNRNVGNNSFNKITHMMYQTSKNIYANGNRTDSKENKELINPIKENESFYISIPIKPTSSSENAIKISIPIINKRDSIQEMSLEEYLSELKNVTERSVNSLRHTIRENSPDKEKNEDTNYKSNLSKVEKETKKKEHTKEKNHPKSITVQVQRNIQKQIQMKQAFQEEENSTKNQSKENTKQESGILDSFLFESNISSTGDTRKEEEEKEGEKNSIIKKRQEESMESSIQESPNKKEQINLKEITQQHTSDTNKANNTNDTNYTKQIHTEAEHINKKNYSYVEWKHPNEKKTKEKLKKNVENPTAQRDIIYYYKDNNPNNKIVNEISYYMNPNTMYEEASFLVGKNNNRNSFNIHSTLKYANNSSPNIFSKILNTSRSSLNYMDMSFFKEQPIGKINVGTTPEKGMLKTQTEIPPPIKANPHSSTQPITNRNRDMMNYNMNRIGNDTKVNEIKKIEGHQLSVDEMINYVSTNQRQSLYHPSSSGRNQKMRVLPVHKPFSSINSKVEQISSLRRNNQIRTTQTSIHIIKALHNDSQTKEAHPDNSQENNKKSANQKVVQVVNTHQKTLEQFKEMMNQEQDILKNTNNTNNSPLKENTINNNAKGEMKNKDVVQTNNTTTTTTTNNNNNNNNQPSARGTRNMLQANINKPRTTYNYTNAFLTNHINHVTYTDNRRTVINESKNAEAKQINRNQIGSLKNVTKMFQPSYSKPLSNVFYSKPAQVMNLNNLNLYMNQRKTQMNLNEKMYDDQVNCMQLLQLRNMKMNQLSENRFIQNKNINNNVAQLNRKTDTSKSTYTSSINYNTFNNPYHIQQKGATMKKSNGQNNMGIPIGKEFMSFNKFQKT